MAQTDQQCGPRVLRAGCPQGMCPHVRRLCHVCRGRGPTKGVLRPWAFVVGIGHGVDLQTSALGASEAGLRGPPLAPCSPPAAQRFSRPPQKRRSAGPTRGRRGEPPAAGRLLPSATTSSAHGPRLRPQSPRCEPSEPSTWLCPQGKEARDGGCVLLPSLKVWAGSCWS